MHLEQYKLVCARRIATNALLWQTPTLASAAQSVFLVSSLNPQISAQVSFFLASVAALIGAASIQLMTKHRHMEVTDSKLLLEFEKKSDGFQMIHGEEWKHPDLDRNWFMRRSSFRIWLFVLCTLLALSFYAVFLAYSKAT
jgi:hypothetical protein